MIIHHGTEEIPEIKNPVVTSGTFDGVHIGHRVILKRICDMARADDGESVLITFWPHPRMILQPATHGVKLLSTFEEKAELIKELGIDHLVRISFTRDFSQMSSEDFIKQILQQKIGTKRLVIGYDHRFGKNREGSFEHLSQNASQYGFAIEEIPRQDIDHVGVSSTKIRKALNSGDIETANTYLGRPYSLTGIVVRGDQIGRTIGFPTANLVIQEEYKLIPSDGIYAVRVDYKDNLYQGMLYIGNRPTIDGLHKKIEVNIFDFDEDLYGAYIKIHLVAFIREDMRFDDLNALKMRLLQDKTASLQLLNS